MARTAYFDVSGKARLVESYCVFADILGFRNEIVQASQVGKEDELFQDFMETVEPVIQQIIVPSKEEVEEKSYPRMWDAKVFTDNVVLGYAIHTGHGEPEFAHALFQLLAFQLTTALDGYFVRGGWSVGRLFMNQYTVYGSALIEAYDLESNKAKFPRVLLSEKMRERVKSHMRFYASNPPQINHLLVDEESGLFTNYLSQTIIDGEFHYALIDKHARNIEKQLLKHCDNKRILPKYQWLAGYHNFFCEQIENEDGYSQEIRVSGEFPPVLIRLLEHDRSPPMA